jgi:hypothetical protein
MARRTAAEQQQLSKGITAALAQGELPPTGLLTAALDQAKTAVADARADPALSTEGRGVAGDLANVLGDVQQVLSEKNQDEALQKLVYHTREAAREAQRPCPLRCPPTPRVPVTDTRSWPWPTGRGPWCIHRVWRRKCECGCGGGYGCTAGGRRVSRGCGHRVRLGASGRDVVRVSSAVPGLGGLSHSGAHGQAGACSGRGARRPRTPARQHYAAHRPRGCPAGTTGRVYA